MNSSAWRCGWGWQARRHERPGSPSSSASSSAHSRRRGPGSRPRRTRRRLPPLPVQQHRLDVLGVAPRRPLHAPLVCAAAAAGAGRMGSAAWRARGRGGAGEPRPHQHLPLLAACLQHAAAPPAACPRTRLDLLAQAAAAHAAARHMPLERLHPIKEPKHDGLGWVDGGWRVGAECGQPVEEHAEACWAEAGDAAPVSTAAAPTQSSATPSQHRSPHKQRRRRRARTSGPPRAGRRHVRTHMLLPCMYRQDCSTPRRLPSMRLQSTRPAGGAARAGADGGPPASLPTSHVAGAAASCRRLQPRPPARPLSRRTHLPTRPSSCRPCPPRSPASPRAPCRSSASRSPWR